MKRLLGLVFVCTLGLSIVGAPLTHAQMKKEPAVEDGKKVELTDKQRLEMEELYKDLLETRKAIIKKYVEYGVIPQEKADKKIAWLEEHFAKMKEHGFMPMWGHHKGTGHHGEE